MIIDSCHYALSNRIWKESLNTDGLQFYQYQQNEQLPLILTQLTQKKPAICDVWNPDCGLGQAQQVLVKMIKASYLHSG